MSHGFKGMPGNIQGMMKQAQKMQADLQRAQEEAEHATADGSAGGGVIKVVANGKNRLLSVTVDKAAMTPEYVEMLPDLFLAAANDALSKAQEDQKKVMEKITGGLNMPGLL